MELKIKKLETHVDLVMKNTGGEKTDVIFYLSRFSQYHSGPETIQEFLNRAPRFIPVRRTDGEFFILGVDNILFVQEREVEPATRIRNLRVLFLDGEKLEAGMFEHLPEQYSRTLDFFNTKDTFLPLLFKKTKIYVNTTNIVKVYEL